MLVSCVDVDSNKEIVRIDGSGSREELMFLLCRSMRRS